MKWCNTGSIAAMMDDVSAFRSRKSVRASAGSCGTCRVDERSIHFWFDREPTRRDAAVTCGDEEEHQDDGGERRQWNCERRRLKET
jgi:hypothetical protein